MGIAELTPQNLQLKAKGMLASLGSCHRTGKCQCVSAVRAVDVPILVYLRSSCNHVTEVGGA